MQEILVVAIMAMMFSILNSALLVFLVKRHEEGCYTIVSYDGYPVKLTREECESSSGIKPGIYFPAEEDEAGAMNDILSRSPAERTNPFRAWDIHTETEDEIR